MIIFITTLILVLILSTLYLMIEHPYEFQIFLGICLFLAFVSMVWYLIYAIVSANFQ